MKSFQRRGGRPVERCSPLEKKIFSAVFELDVCPTSETFRCPPPRKHRYCIHGIIYHQVLFAEIYFGVEILKITRRGEAHLKEEKKVLHGSENFWRFCILCRQRLNWKRKRKKERKEKLFSPLFKQRNVISYSW